MSRVSLGPLLEIFELSVIPARWRQLKTRGIEQKPDGTDPKYWYSASSRRDEIERKVDAGEPVTWTDQILLDVWHALAETEHDRLREALVHLAARTCAWVEDLDSRQGALVPRLPEIDDTLDATVEPVLEAV